MSTLTDLLDDVVADVDGVFLFSPSGSFHQRFREADVDVVVVDTENAVDADTFVELPLEFDNVRDRIRFGVEGAIENGIVETGDAIACSVSVFDDDDADSVIRVRATEDMGSGIYDLFVDSRAEPGVIRDVFEVAIELGKKGQKGKPVGALFVVGDAGKVMNKSRPLSYNPFEKSHVHVGDPIVNVMLKEFSRLDGAFVISDSGKIVSAYRYLEPAAEGVDIPKGLGARHMAAGAITRDTNATAIVLSESDGLVRAFKGGRLILEVDPEAY
ncbi:diadenylate cyclase DacZ [Halopenitus persicus]|uniref:Diadenylate cyclase n=1 Tax=Halopenitus persicus TaxID=1048396 RepID=A0A1H3H145_9EURY|nr:diadenylate cyclase DacZ [Halopenitus persicus]QHS16145.1 diadenylate cyclase [haloarchaeon 3A1-DGR]SDY09246.1 Diadenylate cyclase (c-di-AMP synthetase), DisA_N domain [Halopenitus persicus]